MSQTVLPLAQRQRVLMAQFKMAIKSPNEYIKFAMSDDVHVWYLLISGIDGDNDEFTYTVDGKKHYGQYLCKMVATEKFPYSPPSFFFMTPNGLYKINDKVCISIGEYHSDKYTKTLKMQGFADQLVSGFIGWKDIVRSGGINVENTSEATKQVLAKSSVLYNQKKYPEILAIVNSSFEQYSASWGKIDDRIAEKLGYVQPADNQ